MRALPPLGGVAPPLQCNRWTGGTFGDPDQVNCAKPGKWHIIWTEDVENGICCDEHYEEARERWAFFAVHEYQMECSMPGAVYIYAENRCVVDEEGLGLSTLDAAVTWPRDDETVDDLLSRHFAAVSPLTDAPKEPT